MKRSAHALIVGLSLVAIVSLNAQDVLVTVRVDTTAAAYRLSLANGTDAADRLREVSRNEWVWRCRPGDRLSFDALGFEPVDVANPACESKSVVMTPEPARIIGLETTADESAIVEWRREGVGASVLIASRQVNRLSNANLPIGFTDRIVRIRRPDAAPFSVFIGRDSLTRRIAVPAKVEGGELFARGPDVTIRPDSFLLDGAKGRIVLEADATRHVRAQGLAAGLYTLTPHYVGGALAAAVSLRVGRSETSELLPIAVPPVGGVALGLDGSLLTGDPLAVDVRRLIRAGRTETNQVVFALAVDGGKTDWTLEGLAPGRYDALARDRRGLRAAVAFNVAADQTSGARLAQPKSTASGQVWFGDKPAKHVILAFFAPDDKEWRAETNDRGEYDVALGAPGQYSVHVSPRPYLSSISKPARVVEGTNRIDLKFGGHAIHLRIKRRDGQAIKELVSIHLRGVFSSQDGFIDPSTDGTDVDLGGLLQGSYTVSADTPSGLASSETAAVTTTADHPEADVELLLESYEGTIRVRDELGQPISGVSIVTTGIRLTESAPGEFHLTRVAPGTPIGIFRPPYLPVCRVLSITDLPDLAVTMVTGNEIGTIRLLPARGAAVGYVQDLPGSNCEIPVFRLNPDVKDDNGATIIVVKGLRPGTLRYRPTLSSEYKPWTVPGPPVVFARTSSRN